MPYKDNKKHREHCRQYYRDNKKTVLEWQRRRRSEILEWFYSCIAQLSCIDCDYSFNAIPYVAEFHHTNKRIDRKNMSNLVVGNYKRFCKEVEEGVYLCPTCHKLRHIL